MHTAMLGVTMHATMLELVADDGPLQACINNGSVSTTSGSDVKIIRAVKILRILRIARVLKLVKFVTCAPTSPILPFCLR
jgi:hypothetical protein